MGRHRRSGEAPAAEQYRTGTTGRRRGGAHRGRRPVVPVRTGLLGASAAVAVGVVAVASGILPGGDTYTISGGGARERVQAEGSADLRAQGSASANPSQTPSPSQGGAKAPGPRPSPSAPAGTERAKPSPSKPAAPGGAKKDAGRGDETVKDAASPSATPSSPASESARVTGGASTASDREAKAESAVLDLVNQERAKVGCTPVRADSRLAALAGAFSADMADRNFFDHTDPDGRTPWNRADAQGVKGLGGENIARGQADAAAVMKAWMDSEGHRANILNCDYKSLGVGVQFGDGGPWWTQDFGF
ncbi:CAP domain-containing protein [Streptomyces sp. NPDC001941]|uniref:CAP domain-containing protein n=1 Tax=Streptomyces sp. NPDC001941 TaxID=3154659 RepID=UPI0033259A72